MNVAIYMEGGGERRGGSRAELRQGMEVFLAEIKNACRARRWHWKLVCCGPRNEAYRHFRNARANRDPGIVVLLVDSEGPVGASSCAGHLAARDGWDLGRVGEDAIHLMVQTMEAWIVSDPDALGRYYGQGFQMGALPRRRNVEEVSKHDIAQALDRASQGTSKGKYQKIGHARHLLQRIDPMTARQRCPHCERLFETLLCLMRTAD